MDFLKHSIQMMPVYGIYMTFTRLNGKMKKISDTKEGEAILKWWKKLIASLEKSFPNIGEAAIGEQLKYSAKTKALLELLQSPEVIDKIETIKIIVFVSQKRSVKALLKILKHYHPQTFLNKLNCQTIYGKTGDVRLTGPKQKTILGKFREGSCRCLLSTSVLEEGLDVSDCNYVVRFDKFFSYKSLVQSRGRARAKDSRYIILLNNQDKSDYERL